MLEKGCELTFVLDRPAHGGNIGATARAMKNMGFNKLRLVTPRQFPHPEATNFAASAVDVLDAAECFDDLSEAIADLNLIVAFTNRCRGQRQRIVTPRQLGERMAGLLARPGTRVGLLFGKERTGLESVDVERADLICTIPTFGGTGSLNLGQAVMVVAYELMLGLEMETSADFDPASQGERASAAELDRMFQHMEEVLREIDFLKSRQKRHMMGSLKAIFHRAALDGREVAIMRGIWHEVIASRLRAES